jgi:drug/metabolite transporter (DMT)-like permease
VRPAQVLQLLLLATIWGCAYPITRSAVAHFGPIPLICLRMGTTALVLLPVLIVREGLEPLRRHWRLLALLGTVFTALSFTLIAWASMTIGAGFAAILNATAPMFGAIVAWLWLGERIGAWRFVGLLVGTAGVAVLMWGKVSLRSDSATLVTVSILAVLLSSLMWGFSANFTRKRLAHVDSLTLTVGGMTAASLLLAPLAIADWHGLLFPASPGLPAATHAPGLQQWIEVALLGVVSSGFGFLLYYRLLREVGTVPTMATTFLNPAIAMAIGALWLDEPVTAQTIAGGAIVLAGTALATGLLPRPPAKGGRPATPSHRR